MEEDKKPRIPRARVRIKKTGLVYSVPVTNISDDGRLYIYLPEPYGDDVVYRARSISPNEYEIIAREDKVGMRNKYAGLAMQSLITVNPTFKPEDVAERAVAFADALVEELLNKQI